jgi:hypothetical protein
VTVVVIFMVHIVNAWSAKGPMQIEELINSTTGTGERLMWKFCRDTWGATSSNSL